jgi:transposase
LEFSFDQAAADADADYDGLSVLVATVPLHLADADSLFTHYKEQVLLEHTHHQLKTPLAVRPIFLKNPRRVEALACLMLLASTVYHLLQRCYRQQLPADAPVKEQRTTTETLLRAFAGFTLRTRRTRVGRVISPTQLSGKQRDILNRLRFPTPGKILAAKLANPPPC